MVCRWWVIVVVIVDGDGDVRVWLTRLTRFYLGTVAHVRVNWLGDIGYIVIEDLQDYDTVF